MKLSLSLINLFIFSNSHSYTPKIISMLKLKTGLTDVVLHTFFTVQQYYLTRYRPNNIAWLFNIVDNCQNNAGRTKLLNLVIYSRLRIWGCVKINKAEYKQGKLRAQVRRATKRQMSNLGFFEMPVHVYVCISVPLYLVCQLQEEINLNNRRKFTSQ